MTAHSQQEMGVGPTAISGPLFVLKMIASFGVDVGFGQVGKLKFICNSCFPSEALDSFSHSSALDLETIRIASMCLQSGVQFLDTCDLLHLSSNPSSSSSLSEMQYTLLAATERLVSVLADKYSQWDTISETRKWFPACEEAMYALFRLHPYPEELLCRLVLNVFVSWKNATKCCSSTVTTCRLARFLFLLGQGLLGLLLYTERMAGLSKSIKEKEKAQKPPSAQQTHEKEASRASKSSKKKSQPEEQGTKGYEEDEGVDAMEEEMGMAAAVDADDEKVCSSALLCHIPHSLLPFFDRDSPTSLNMS
jgi:hypothetical protein